jgi:hypothetical protein
MLISLESIYRGYVTVPLKMVQTAEGKKKTAPGVLLGADNYALFT